MKTHPLQVGYLVFGLIFLGLSASWGLDQLGVVSNPDPGLIVPITLVVAGAIGLLAYGKRFLQDSRTDNDVTDNEEVPQ
jgi:hypothetical protein